MEGLNMESSLSNLREIEDRLDFLENSEDLLSEEEREEMRSAMLQQLSQIVHKIG